ncbi:MAG: GIY-YIG nuclease family protein [Paraclostridium sp.]
MNDYVRNHYVYETTNLINGKKYIGKRSCKCEIEHDKYLGSGKYLVNAIKKYGKDNFSKEILQVCENEKMALEWEKVYIEQVKAYDNNMYYNLSMGGEGYKSCEVKKMWEDNKHREFMISMIKGKWKDEDYLLKMKNRNGRTEEQILRHGEIMKRKWRSSEYREKMKRHSYRGENHARASKIVLLNNREVFGCIKYASEKFKISQSKISNNCLNNIKYIVNGITNEKLVFSYYDDYLKMNDDHINEILDGIENEKITRKRGYGGVRKRVILMNNGMQFESITSAAKFIGLKSESKITDVCKGKKKSAGKINGEKAIWKYIG